MLFKICQCGKILKQNERCKCRHKRYDKTSRKQTEKGIYESVEWKKVREQVKARANGLDEYALKYEGRLKQGKISHHIYEVEEKPELIYALSNLVYVSIETHNKIHREYERSEEAKVEMQKKLNELRRGV